MTRLLIALGMTLTACSSPPAMTPGPEAMDLSLARRAAVEQTIKSRPECTALPAFYWEIGDPSGPLASGSVGTSFTATSRLNVASASKLVWGAYVVERFKDSVDAIDFRAMSMQSGYTDLTYTSCVTAASVQDCLNTGKNGQLTPSAVDHFFYGGGHFQKQAVDLGLGALGNSALGAEVKKYVGAELDLGYSSPQPAGGLQTTPTAYAAFLRKLLAGQLDPPMPMMPAAAHLLIAVVLYITASSSITTWDRAVTAAHVVSRRCVATHRLADGEGFSANHAAVPSSKWQLRQRGALSSAMPIGCPDSRELRRERLRKTPRPAWKAADSSSPPAEWLFHLRQFDRRFRH